MEAIEKFLNSIGFIAMRPVSLTDTPCFSGSIQVDDWNLQLELRFSQGRFNYPSATLIDWPFDKTLRETFGQRHISDEGNICYVDESQVWWDSSMASSLVAGAIVSINKILRGNLDGLPAGDVIARDFDGYWKGQETLYLSNIVQNGQLFSQVQKMNSLTQWLVPSNASSWIATDDRNSSFRTWIVLRVARPATLLDTESWPPKTISQILGWLHANFPNSPYQLVKNIHRYIIPKGKSEQKNYSVDVGVILMWPSSDGVDIPGCGFSFVVPEIPAQAIAHTRINSATKLLMSSKNEVTRYSLERADPQYIQTRNSRDLGQSLKDKKIILVGAGTIGGHLAKLLCSQGAGWGKRGELNIIDFDIFNIENIGRHLLGAECIGYSKAQVLKNRLNNDFPYLNIKVHQKAVTECWPLFSDDCIVIDATGSQTVSIALADKFSEQKINPVILHSWIHGHGAATVAFLNDRKARNSACYRCLWKLENNAYQPRYPLSFNPELDGPQVVGCHSSYHEYASTISILAAVQAIDLLNDYLMHRVKNTLKFNILKPDLCQKRPDTAPTKSNSCPICHR